MNSDSTSTAVSPPEIPSRVKEAIARASNRAHPHRLERLRAVQETVNSLRDRGLLTRRKISVTTTADFERRYRGDSKG